METAYTLRPLATKDIFKVTPIINKIGISEFSKCFKADDVRKAIGKNSASKLVGITVALDIAGVVCANLSKCEKELYSFLSDLSGLNENEISELPLGDFGNMIVDVIELDGFKDFMKAVSRLFN